MISDVRRYTQAAKVAYTREKKKKSQEGTLEKASDNQKSRKRPNYKHADGTERYSAWDRDLTRGKGRPVKREKID